MGKATTPNEPKRGRPPLPLRERKVKQIKLVVTKDQLRILEAAAERDRRTLSDWIRSAALQVAETPPANK